jgi:hypothetical protein
VQLWNWVPNLRCIRVWEVHRAAACQRLQCQSLQQQPAVLDAC